MNCEQVRERDLQHGRGRDKKERGVSTKTVYFGGGRRSITWLQGSQASPTHTDDKTIMKIRYWRGKSSDFKKKLPQKFRTLVDVEVHDLEIQFILTNLNRKRCMESMQ